MRTVPLVIAKWIAAIVAVFLLVAVSLYLVSPWLIHRLAPAYAERLGLTRLQLTVGHPGLHGIRIDSFYVSMDAIAMEGSGAQLSYDLRELLQGRLDELAIDSLAAVINPGPSSGQDVEPPTLSEMIDRIPFRRLGVSRLSLDVPAIGFRGTGSASKDENTVSLLLDGLEPERASHFRISAEITHDDFNFRFADRGESDDREFLSIRGAIRNDALEIDGDIDLTGYALSLASALASLPVGKGSVSGTFRTQLPWPLPEVLPWRESTVTFPAFAADWVSEQGDVAVRALSGSLNVDRGKVAVAASGTLYKRIGDSELTIVLPKNHALRYENSTLTGGAGLRVGLKQPGTELQAALRSYSYFESGTESQPDRATFDADINVQADRLRVSGRLDGEASIAGIEPLYSKGRTNFNGKVILDEQAHEAGIQSVFIVKADNLSIDSSLSTGVIKKAFVGVDFNLETGAGELTASNTLKFSKPLAKALIPDWDRNYDLDSGRIEVSLALTWLDPNRINASVSLSLTDCRAHFDEYLATDIGGHLNFRSASISDVDRWLLEPATLAIGTLETGLTINDLQVDVAWSGNRVDVSRMQMMLLGGSASMTPFMYEIDTGKAEFTMMLRDVELSRILALEGDDIQGTGSIDGTLPVTVTNDRARVDNGTLRAQPPGGHIRLTSGFSGPTGQPGLDFALLALKDFRYTDLSSELSYTENGDMNLAVHLKGRNPSVEKGRAIQYNLNITENIPVLLESLRLQDSLTEKIELKTRQ